MPQVGGFSASPNLGETRKLLETGELIAITKAINLGEYHFSWPGGSVSPVIRTFREVFSRDQERGKDLADWLLKRTTNPYIPFGTRNFGARSYQEYRIAKDRDEERKRKREAERNYRERRAKEERVVRTEQRLRAANERNTEIRREFLAKLGSMSAKEQIVHLAWDRRYPVEFYLTCLAYQVDEHLLLTLDATTKEALRVKLRGRRRGPWKRFKRLLLNL